MNKKDNKCRMLYPDVVKAIAIICVVYGHCIQYGSGNVFYVNEYYFSDPIFKLIYSFHMPLFMLISGYFFYESTKKYKAKDLMLKKMRELLIPIIAWTFIAISLYFRFDLGCINNIIYIFSAILHNLWFLWSILFCAFWVMGINKLQKHSMLAHVVLLVVFCLMPDKLNTHYYKFMYPYFIAGYYWNRNNYFEKFKRYLMAYKQIIFVGIIIFGFLYCLYDYNTYIYTSKICIINKNCIIQIITNIHRWIIGFVGSGLILFLTYMLHDRGARLSKLGENSFGIYIISDLLNKVLLEVTKIYINDLNYGIALLEALIILGITNLMTIEIKKIPFLNRILLGTR